MTYLEIDKALYDIVRELCDECDCRLSAIPKENKNEHKATIIEREMYWLCNRAGLLYFRSDNRDKVLKNRECVIGQILSRYTEINRIFVSFDEDERMTFLAALQAEIYMRDQIFKNYLVELDQAKAAGDAKKIFEFGIKIGAVERVFAAWEAWRVEHNVYPGMFEEGLR